MARAVDAAGAEGTAYLDNANVAQVMDRMVGELMKVRPDDLPAFLGRNAKKIAEDALGVASPSAAAGSGGGITGTGDSISGKFGLHENKITSWAPVQPVINPMAKLYPEMGFMKETDMVRVRITAHGDSAGGGAPPTSPSKKRFAGGEAPELITRAGPGREVYFAPGMVTAAICVTGGLCPGLNSIIKELFNSLHQSYKVRRVLGIRYGFNGFTSEEFPPIELTPEFVEEVHYRGGSCIGCARGGFCPRRICDAMIRMGINVLFTVGGDGSLWCSDVLYQECRKRKLPFAIIGLPKSIDNDVMVFDRTFGFQSAVEAGVQAIRCAHVEATAAPYAVGICKLMGRHAGFVARNAAIASNVADLVLIPEIPFKMQEVVTYLEEVVKQKKHAVVIVAEGAGAEMLKEAGQAQARGGAGAALASGGAITGDIGTYLRDAVNKHLKPMGGRSFYIDPSYIVRSVAATPTDHEFCTRLAHNAVHAAMRGYTGVTIGQVHNFIVMVPTEVIARGSRRINPNTSLQWQRAVEALGMPHTFSGLGIKPPVQTRARGTPEQCYDKQ